MEIIQTNFIQNWIRRNKIEFKIKKASLIKNHFKTSNKNRTLI